MGSPCQHVADVLAAIAPHRVCRPTIGLILGSGLGELAEQVESSTRIPYAELPHLHATTALGHRGQLVLGQLAGQSVVIMQGRLHAYEGHTMHRLTLPVRVMHAMGAHTLIVTNAAGGLNPQYRVGELMAIRDHINRLGSHLRGPVPRTGTTSQHPDDNRFLWRRPSGKNFPYSPQLRQRALAVARQQQLVCHEGVYVAMLGPTYETRSEYRFARQLGGDVVGMSTVPEVLVAATLGMQVLGLSTVTNECRPDQLRTTSGEEVVAAAVGASKKMRTLLQGLLAQLPAT